MSRCQYGDGLSEGNLYPFQISVDDTEVMHILQAVRNPSQLDSTSVSLLQDQVTTYKLSAVHLPIPPREFVDVPVFHPLGYHRKPVLTHRHPEEWQDIRMPEVLPGNAFSAESLQRVHP